MAVKGRGPLMCLVGLSGCKKPTCASLMGNKRMIKEIDKYLMETK